MIFVTKNSEVSVMVPYEKLKNLYEVLIEAIEEETTRKHRNEREHLKSKGIEDASRFAIKLIERTKETGSRESILSSLNYKVGISIYSLIKYEEKYAIKNIDRYRMKIIYYQSLVEALQIIRNKIRNII